MWGSGLAGIVCAVVALVYGDSSHVWQVRSHGLHDAVAHVSCSARANSVIARLITCVQVAFVASFVSKLSDTVSSEIGKVRWPLAWHTLE